MMLSPTCAIGEVSHNPSHYRAEQYDSDLGLYYLRARYYNPLTGRFVSRDPENGPIGMPIMLHKYVYVGDNPTNRIDPSGRDILEDALVLEGKTLTTVEYLNTIGCYANITFAAVTTLLSEKFDLSTAFGAAATIYGCVSISWAPEKAIVKLVKTAADLGACAIAAGVAVNDLNDYLEKPNAANEEKLVTDYLGTVLTWGITGIGAALED